MLRKALHIKVLLLRIVFGSRLKILKFIYLLPPFFHVCEILSKLKFFTLEAQSYQSSREKHSDVKYATKHEINLRHGEESRTFFNKYIAPNISESSLLSLINYARY